MNRAQLEEALEGITSDGPFGSALAEEIYEALKWVCTKCGKPGADTVTDRYGIYYGTLCEPCEKASGIRAWVFDASYAGERLEEEDY
ncbi:MAG: hypothetical protein KAJ42_06185 [Gemmatimonadetes bacterium]|nr:hypothetical protein [Gemmatimonadota bacterium]